MNTGEVREGSYTTAFLPEPAQTGGYSTPILWNSHKLTLTDLAKNRMDDNCVICRSPVFSDKEEAVVERCCHHLSHAKCQINRRISSPEVQRTCESCQAKSPEGMDVFTVHSNLKGWAAKAEKKCIQNGCLYSSKLGESEQLCCPFPVSMFPDNGSPASGFVHKYGKLIDSIIDKFLSVANLNSGDIGKSSYEGITQEEQDEMVRMYGSGNDLNCMLDKVGTLQAEILSCAEMVEKKLSKPCSVVIDMTNQEDYEIISETIEDRVGDVGDRGYVGDVGDRGGESRVVDCASESEFSMIDSAKMVRAAVENSKIYPAIENLRMAIVKGSQNAELPGPEIAALASVLNPDELISGLSYFPEKDISIVRQFRIPGVRMPLEIRIDSKKLNGSNKTIIETVGEIVNIIRCALVTANMAKNYPNFFDDLSDVYLKLPFDYPENKITIVSKGKMVPIPLNEVINLETRSVNYTALFNAVDNFKELGINSCKLSSPNVFGERSYGLFGQRSSQMTFNFGHSESQSGIRFGHGSSQAQPNGSLGFGFQTSSGLERSSVQQDNILAYEDIL